MNTQENPVGETPKPKKFLKIGELAERWGVTERTVYKECERGRLKKTHIAGAVRFAMSEIERYERQPTS